ARILEAYRGEGLDQWAAEQQDRLLPETFTDASLFVDDCPDIKDCLYEFPPGVLNRVGPIPGGPYGRCWSWDEFNCNPCVETFRYYNNKCHGTYPDCEGRCNTACWAGLCN